MQILALQRSHQQTVQHDKRMQKRIMSMARRNTEYISHHLDLVSLLEDSEGFAAGLPLSRLRSGKFYSKGHLLQMFLPGPAPLPLAESLHLTQG